MKSEESEQSQESNCANQRTNITWYISLLGLPKQNTTGWVT